MTEAPQPGPTDGVQVIVSHSERTTLRVGSTFLKVDAAPDRIEREAAVMALAPVPTATVLWVKPPVLALDALPGTALGVLGAPSPASSAAWVAAGAVVRQLHDAPLPPWPSSRQADSAAVLDAECEALVRHGVLPADLVGRNRQVAEAVFRPWTPAFIHGDLQITHVFVDGSTVTGILDWSEAGQGDPMCDLASLTLGHEEHLAEVAEGYGSGVDVDAVRGWWSMRSLLNVRWLVEHGFDAFAPGCEVDVLKARM